MTWAQTPRSAETLRRVPAQLGVEAREQLDVVPWRRALEPYLLELVLAMRVKAEAPQAPVDAQHQARR